MTGSSARTGAGFKGKTPLFQLGAIAATPGAMALLQNDVELAAMFITRHQHGDWGDVDSEDWGANNSALRYGSRILSTYKLLGAGVLWIITEADRATTTLLLPDEY